MGTAEGAKKGWTAERRARQSQQQKEVWDEKKRVAHAARMHDATMAMASEARSERVRKGHTPVSDALRSASMRKMRATSEAKARWAATEILPETKVRRSRAARFVNSQRDRSKKWGTSLVSNVGGRAQWRLILNTYKMALGCYDCGYRAHPLALECDHVPGRGKKLFTIGAAGHRSLTEIIAELEKCDVVCANCHRIRTADRKRSIVAPAIICNKSVPITFQVIINIIHLPSFFSLKSIAVPETAFKPSLIATPTSLPMPAYLPIVSMFSFT